MPTGGTAVGAVYRHIYVVAGFRRDVFGYDLATGRLIWRFHTIPDPGEFGGDTWKTRINLMGANGWAGMALDESRGVAFFTTGSPKPNFSGPMHVGQNLFGNCVFALDALTGKLIWYFQGVHHDVWDMDIGSPPNLVTVMHDGRRVDAVATFDKPGNTYLLDRMTGKPLFPWRERRAPVSHVPGEVTWPYQPDPVLPEPVWRMEFKPEDVTDLSPEQHAFVEGRLAGMNYGFFVPLEYDKPVAYYGLLGGGEWCGATFDPPSGRLYVSVNHVSSFMQLLGDKDPPPRIPPTPGELTYRQYCMACHGPNREGQGIAPPLRGVREWLKDDQIVANITKGRNAMPPIPVPESQRRALLDFLMARDRGPEAAGFKRRAPQELLFTGWNNFKDNRGYPANKPPWSTLDCLDLNTGRIVWAVPLGEFADLKAQGIPPTGTESLGGGTVTAGGIVFCGGTHDSEIRAFDSDTGKVLWGAGFPPTERRRRPPTSWAAGSTS